MTPAEPSARSLGGSRLRQPDACLDCYNRCWWEYSLTPIITRSLWAEKVAADIASRPLVRECVFSNMRFLDSVEREVCDLVLALRSDAIVGQIKSQEDPLSRGRARLASWVVKNAKRAASQLQGAIRTIADRDVWCEHPRRGRVEFSKGELKAVQGLFLVENLGARIVLPPGVRVHRLLEASGLRVAPSFCFPASLCPPGAES